MLHDYVNGTYNVRMFSQAGFFHFVEHHSDPLGTLDAEIRSAGDVADSLVVLPEAFNLGRPYGTEQEKPSAYERDSLVAELQERSRQQRIIFVAGLLDPVPAGERPRSSAYLIDGEGCHPICHKCTSDGKRHYRPEPARNGQLRYQQSDGLQGCLHHGDHLTVSRT